MDDALAGAIKPDKNHMKGALAFLRVLVNNAAKEVY